MSDLLPVANATIEIGTAPLAPGATDLTEASFSGVTWEEIDGWQLAGDYGDTREVVRTPLINRGRVAKTTGPRDAGTMENRFAIIPGDAGMAQVVAATNSLRSFPIRITYDDAPETGSAPVGSRDMFTALITSAPRVNGEAAAVRMRSVVMEITSNVVELAAATGD